MSKLTCPYCFEQFSFSQIAFRCLNPNPALCSPEEDKELAKYQKLNTLKLNRVFKPQDAMWRAVRASLTGRSGKMPRCQCGERTKKVCPFCHNDLPHGFGEIRMKTIALIGAKDSGKSIYIAVLIHELGGDNVGGKFNAALQALDERTTSRYKTEFERYIYKERQAIPFGTVSANANPNYPLIYKFSLERSSGLSFKRQSISSMVFFDTAGEDLNNIDVMSTVVKYLAHSDGIIFLLDPLQMLAIRNLTAGSVKLPDENTEPVEIIGRAVQLIRESNGLGQREKIKTPVAVAFSKIDAIRNLFDPSSPIHNASNHNGYFDVTDSETLSENIKAHLAKWERGELDRLLQHNFDKYNYFGLSALGASPDANGSLAFGTAPFRVEDPFLWILYQQGIIPGKRSV